MFNGRPDETQEWIVVRIRATYRGTDESGYISDSDFRVTGSEGQIHSRYLVVMNDALGAEVFKDGSTEGDVALVVTKDEFNLILIYEPSLFGDERYYFALGEITLPIIQPQSN